MRAPTREQIEILAVAVAANAHRNGGEPRAAEPVLAHETIDGPRVAARAEVDIADGAPLLAREIGRSPASRCAKAAERGEQYRQVSPVRLASIGRSIETLCRRGFLVRCDPRSRWEEIYSSRRSIARELAREAIVCGRNESGGYYLTAAAIAAVASVATSRP